MSLVRYLWASPNSLIGLLFAPAAVFTPGGVELVDGVLELQAPLIAWTLKHCSPMCGGVAAITLGHVVLGRDRDALVQTRAHEHVHVRQYERWGPAFIPAYLLASLWGVVTGAGAYDGNVFERAAFKGEQFG
jgi:membrane protein YqaA with SNARE-associated domain